MADGKSRNDCGITRPNADTTALKLPLAFDVRNSAVSDTNGSLQSAAKQNVNSNNVVWDVEDEGVQPIESEQRVQRRRNQREPYCLRRNV